MLTGNGGSNVLLGGALADVLDGQGGNDVLDGGTGRDTLTGGDGADTFVITKADAFRGSDLILDFEDGVDKISFSGFAGLDFNGLVFTPDGGNTVISQSGEPTAEALVVLVGVTSGLDAGDFIFA